MRYTAFCEEWIGKDYSPMFEWCSPEHQIVINHKTSSLISHFSHLFLSLFSSLPPVNMVWPVPLSRLFSFDDFMILIALRDNVTGSYLPYKDILYYFSLLFYPFFLSSFFFFFDVH